jgi:hypothetical protein
MAQRGDANHRGNRARLHEPNRYHLLFAWYTDRYYGVSDKACGLTAHAGVEG